MAATDCNTSSPKPDTRNCEDQRNMTEARIRKFSQDTIRWHMPHLQWFVVFILMVHGLPFGKGQADSAGAIVAENCSQLQSALMNGEEGRIVITGDISCKNSDWSGSVELNRDVVISGESQGSVDWGNLEDVLILGDNVHLTLKNIIMIQDKMERHISLKAITTGQGSLVFFAGVVTGVRLCPPNTGRRLFSDGETPLSNGIVARNLTLQWRGSSKWQFCNSVFQCDVESATDKVLRDYFTTGTADGTCQYKEQFALQSGAGNESSTKAVVLALAIGIPVVIIVVVVVAGMSLRLVLKQRRVKSVTDIHATKADVVEDDDLCLTRSRDNIAPSVGVWNFRLSDVQLAEPLGRGSFGRVYKGYWQGTAVAIKVIMHGRTFLESKEEPFEAYLSRHISHPNVVQTFLIHTRPRVTAANAEHSSSLSETNVRNVPVAAGGGAGSVLLSSDDVFGSMGKGPALHDGDVYETWIVLEYCDGGSLAQAIRQGIFMSDSDRRHPKMKDVLLTALDVAYAMSYLHSVRIIHGDLKAENVLLKSDSSDSRGFVCKAGDFGLSRFLAEDTHIETFTYGTITHMPPELLKGGVLTPAADMYSFGVLCWELLTGMRPYSTKNHGEIVLAVVNEGMRPALPSYCPAGFAELLQDCWRQSHLERPSFPEVIDRLKRLLDLEVYHSPSPTPTIMEVPYSDSPSGTRDIQSQEQSFVDTPDELQMSRVGFVPPTPQLPTFDDTESHSIGSSNTSHVHTGPRSGDIFDYNMDGKHNPCFLMSTQLSAPSMNNHNESQNFTLTRVTTGVIEEDENGEEESF